MTERDHDITQLRTFNRLFTARMGLLDAYLNQSEFTLSEARILYEIATRPSVTAAEIGRLLGLDRAQISRTLRRFADRGWIARAGDPENARQQHLSLTPAGEQVYARLDAGSRNSAAAFLDGFAPSRRRRFLAAAAEMTMALTADAPPELVLRAPQPGELGLVLARQSALYASEYGYDGGYEGLVAGILSEFQRNFDAEREAAWIAEIDGRMAGSIFLVRTPEPDVAKLRLLYVEPDARGAGVGRRLIDSCIERARSAGYRRLDLWTDRQLAAARTLYTRAGFTLQSASPEHHFGQDIVSESWSLPL